MEEVEQKRWRRDDINEDGRKVQRKREHQRHETRGTQRLPVTAQQRARVKRVTTIRRECFWQREMDPIIRTTG